MLVLVTGATGFIGSHVVRLLVGKPDVKVRCLVRSREKLRACLGDAANDVEMVVGDVLSASDVGAAMNGVNAVIHAAALTPSAENNAEQMLEMNTGSTKMMISLAAELGGVSRFVYVSSIASIFRNGSIDPEVMGEPPLDPYSRSKYEAELIVRDAQATSGGMHIDIVYPSAVIGPLDPAVSVVNKTIAGLINDACLVTDGGGLWVDARDLAAYISWLVTSDRSDAYHLVTGSYVTWADFTETLNRLSGGRVRVFKMRAGLLLAIGAVCDFFSKFLPIALPVTKEMAVFATQMRPCDNTVNFLEAVPQPHPFESSLKATVDELKKKGEIKS